MVRQHPGQHGCCLRDAEEEVTASGSGALQHHRSGSHLGKAKGAPLQCELVATPSVHVPVFVDMGRRPRLVERQSSAGERQGSRGMAALAAAMASAGCLTKTIPSASTKRAPNVSR